MALKATIYKANINIADMNRNHYADVQLTLAQHPSENEQRLMLRLLAWIYHGDESLIFTKDLFSEDEPALWKLNDYNEPVLWIEMGLPDEKRLKKASNQSDQVMLLAYGERAANVWWQQNKNKVAMFKNLTVLFLDDAQSEVLQQFCQRSMTLQATLQEDSIWLSDGNHHADFKLTVWQEAKA